MTDQSAADLLSVPKGGGAVRGIGETFQANAQTGTGQLGVPIDVPPGRGSLTPTLRLSYNSGSGNSPFGLGWSLPIPTVTRRTDKHVPRYDDADVFVLSGAEYLVPVRSATAAGTQRYRPQTESLFARIEHHTDAGDYWTAWTKDGLRSTYGTPKPAGADATWSDPSVIANPEDPTQVFSWPLTKTSDTFGNTITYTYGPDSSAVAGPQRYVQRVSYAGYTDATGIARDLIQIRFIWQTRPDVHTDRRPGFPVSTGQRCKAIETLVDTGTPTGTGVKTKDITLIYTDGGTPARQGDNGVSLLTRVTVTGYDGAVSETLPPLELGYTLFEPDMARRYRTVGAGISGPPPLTDHTADLVDLFGTGLPDVLQLSAEAARYWRNTGDGSLQPPHTLVQVPPVTLGSGEGQIIDADGDGRPDLLVTTGLVDGYFPLGPTGFDPPGYVPYSQAPAFGLTDPQTRLIDVTGDGVTDAVQLGATVRVYFNERGRGWTAQPSPSGSPLTSLSFTDPRVKLADMTGDGLTDIVLVANGRVQYWPNLGWGHFAPPVDMGDSPTFPDAALYGTAGYDPDRLLLTDVDGDGCADVVYVGSGATTVWVNQAGHGFTAPYTVRGTPAVDSAASVRGCDFLGSGTAGILWTFETRPSGDAGYRFLDLTGGGKPYLLTHVDNHTGGQSNISYAPSTGYAIADARAGTPWRTTLPFPVQVVATITASEHFSGSTTTSTYTYHHGYWDGADREFRGFARVDVTDTTVFDPTSGLPPQQFCPPTETRTWYHVGPVGPEYGAWTEIDLSAEYWDGDTPILTGDRSTIPVDLGRRQQRDVIRTLRGRPLRAELYAADDLYSAGNLAAGSPSPVPYTVTEHCYGLVPVLDPPGGGDAAPDAYWLAQPVVAVHDTGTRTSQWERGSDPLTLATVTGHYDAYGNAGVAAAAAVPRGRNPRAALAGLAVEPYLATAAQSTYAIRDDSTHYLSRRGSQTRHEIVNDGTDAVTTLLAAALNGTPPQRLLGLTRTFYDGDTPYSSLPAGQLGEHGLPTSTATLALTRGTLAVAHNPAALPPYLDSPAIRSSDGLRGSYFRDPGLAELAFTRPDPAIDFKWQGGPDPALCQPTFTARWEGQLSALYSETYTITAQARGGVRVWIAGRLVIDDWAGGTIDPAAQVPLTAGTATPLTVEYSAAGYAAGLTLTWSGPSQAAETIPAACLTPPAGPTNLAWTSDYPTAFRTLVPDLAGYVYQRGSDGVYEPGYYTVSRTRYDAQDDATTAMGLLTGSRDALGNTTVISYDTPYRMHPAQVTDPLGLTRTAAYDYLVLKPNLITDANDNRTQIGYTALGLLAWTAACGKTGANEGDTPAQTGVTCTYDFTAFDTSPADARQPASTTVIRRVDHRWTLIDRANAARQAAGHPPMTDAEIADMFPTGEYAAYPDRFRVAVDYTDGLGRALQTRTCADTVILDTLGLPADQTQPTAPATARPAAPGEVPVSVSGWKTYDNKGRVVRQWEPFYSSGWAYQQPDNPTLSALADVTTAYDPRGIPILITAADGSQTLTVTGTPPDLATPDTYTPTPWTTYHYDPDDNAERTHPDTSTEFRNQWNTPASSLIDALGRAVEQTARVTTTDAGGAVTSTTYDIDGNILTVTDPLGRTAAHATYDLLKRAWAHTGLDTGRSGVVLDPLGGTLETRDDKGAITLAIYDPGHRRILTWAADRTGQTPTLRQVTVHGDDPASQLARADAKSANVLGRIWRTYDEAGAVDTPSYNLDGNPLISVRRILRPDLLLSGVPAGPGDWSDTSYRVDWQPGPGETVADHGATMLDATSYRIDTDWDALTRPVTRTMPTDTLGQRAVIEYTYGWGGHLTSFAVDGASFLELAIYNARGQDTLTVLADGTLLRYLYDPHTLRLTRIRSEPGNATAPLTWPGASSPLQIIQDYGYTYDLTGNLLTLNDRSSGSGLPTGVNASTSPNPDSLNRAFTYDPLYRLVTATGRETAAAPPQPWVDTPAGTDITKAQPYTETYTYDLAGNVTALAHTSRSGYQRALTLASGTNRLTGLTVGSNGGSTYTYTHDRVGNLTTEATVRLLEWDHANRLTTFRTQTGTQVPSVYAQYRYDTSGQRVLKVVHKSGKPSDVTIYIGDVFERVITGAVPVPTPQNATSRAIRAVAAAGRSVLSTFTSGTVFDTVYVRDAAGAIVKLQRGAQLPGDPYPQATYQLSDHLGSSTVTLDAKGVALNREEYTPYGESSFGSYVLKRYRFTAKERDEESGFYHHGARYYLPWTLRWASADPSGAIDSTNLYVYVRCNPIMLRDPTGFQSEPPKPGTHAGTGGSSQSDRSMLSRALQTLREVVVGMGKALAVQQASQGITNESLAAEALTSVIAAKTGWSWAKQSAETQKLMREATEGVIKASQPTDTAQKVGFYLLPIASAVGHVWASGRSAGTSESEPSLAPETSKQAPVRIFSARVLTRMVADNPDRPLDTFRAPDPQHNFPSSLAPTIFQLGTRRANADNSYVLYSLQAGAEMQTYSNKELPRTPFQEFFGASTVGSAPKTGTYEIGVRPSASGNVEVITHWFFNPK